MATQVGSLFWATGLDTSGVKKDSKGLGKGLLGSLNPATIGAAALGTAIAKVGKEVYQFSADFNKAMLEVKTISSATQEDMEGISESIKDISLQPINDDAVGLSEAFYQIVSAGHDGANGIKILDAAAKAATGGVTDTTTAADGLTTVLNAWGMTASEVEKVSDQMFTTVKLGKTTFGELGKNIAKVAPLAAATGIEFEQIAAATATLTKQGTPTTEAFTQMKAAIIALNKNLGDGWAKTMTLQEGLVELRKKAGGSDTELQKLTGSSEAMLAVLATTGKMAKVASDDLEQLGESTGASNDAFKIMSEESSIMWKQVGNQFKVAMSDMGDGMLVASKGLAAFLSAAMQGTDKLGDNFDAIGENVEGFNERMKVLRNEGVSFFDAIAGAAFKSNEKVQRIVDKEKAEAQSTIDQIKAMQAEYAQKQESGASATELAAFKQNLLERYALIKEQADKEAKLQNENARKAKNFSAFTLGIGSATASREGIKAKDLQDVADGYNSIYDAVQKLGVVEKTNAEQVNESIVKLRTIVDIEKELKELKDQTGKFGDPQLEADNIQKIVDKTAELEGAWQKVRDVRNAALGGLMTGAPGEKKMKSITPLLKVPKQDLKLMPVKKVTIEQKKQRDLTEEITKMLGETSFIFGSIGETVGKFNPELGETLTNVSEMAGKAANFAGSLASGDWVGAVASGVSLIGDIVDEFKEVDEKILSAKKQAELMKEVYAEINEINQAILDNSITLGLSDENRLKILDETRNAYAEINKEGRKLNENADPEKLKEYKSILEQIDILSLFISEETDKDIKKDFLKILANLKLEKIKLEFDVTINSTKLDSLFAEVDRLNEAMSQSDLPEDLFNVYSEQLDGVLSQISEIQNAYQNMISAYEDMAGVSSSTITDSIVDGLLNGLELAESGLGDFAESFGKMMQDSGTNYLKKLFESKYLLTLMEKFAESAADGIDSDEIDALRNDYRNAIEAFKPIADAWKEVSSSLEEDSVPELEGLSGEIQGIQQETASILAGTFESVRSNMISLVDLTNDHIEVSQTIADNTSVNPAMLQQLQELNQNISASNENNYGL